MTELKSSSGVIPVVVAAYRPRSQGRAGFCGKVVQFPENQSKSESGWVTPCVPCSRFVSLTVCKEDTRGADEDQEDPHSSVFRCVGLSSSVDRGHSKHR
mmetsp:Transcript_7072/g.16397  ORF Transcript_7072/g.16397 Transcript_7072/m.16397 type:complete len:99 (-) Transcript_7072:799-1095(-)